MAYDLAACTTTAAANPPTPSRCPPLRPDAGWPVHPEHAPCPFQLGLAEFALVRGVGSPFSKPANRQVTPVAVAFGALFLLHLVAGLVVVPGNWPNYWCNLRFSLLFLPLAF